MGSKQSRPHIVSYSVLDGDDANILIRYYHKNLLKYPRPFAEIYVKEGKVVKAVYS